MRSGAAPGAPDRRHPAPCGGHGASQGPGVPAVSRAGQAGRAQAGPGCVRCTRGSPKGFLFLPGGERAVEGPTGVWLAVPRPQPWVVL